MPGLVAAQHRTTANKFLKWHEIRLWMDGQTLRSAPMHRVTSCTLSSCSHMLTSQKVMAQAASFLLFKS